VQGVDFTGDGLERLEGTGRYTRRERRQQG
jgi:hypothetical protein